MPARPPTEGAAGTPVPAATDVEEAARAVIAALLEQGATLATAESLTGGWIGMALTTVPGASAVYRGGLITYDEPPAERGLQGAGSVHHVAWASNTEEHEEWRERAISAGASPTPVIDRFYFRSIYFREPSGVLFEIATLGPGFTVDEPLESLGEKLSLPPAFEHLRDQVEPNLRPITNPRTAAKA